MAVFPQNDIFFETPCTYCVKMFRYHLSILTKPTIPFHLFVVLFRDPHFPLAFLKLTIRLCLIMNVRRYSPSRVPSKNVLGGLSTPELEIQKKGSKLLYVTLKSAPLRGHATEWLDSVIWDHVTVVNIPDMEHLYWTSGDLVEMTITGEGVAMGGIIFGRLSVINIVEVAILGILVITFFIWRVASNFLDNFVNIIEHLFVITSAWISSKSFFTDTVGKRRV